MGLTQRRFFGALAGLVALPAREERLFEDVSREACDKLASDLAVYGKVYTSLPAGAVEVNWRDVTYR